MKKLALIAATVLFAASPAMAQLTPEAFTWGAEVTVDGRTTVISAWKAGPHWTVEMMCERRVGKKTETRRWRGQARWMQPGYMHALMGDDTKVSVIPTGDGVSIMASPAICATGPGMLTSGGG
jgi:hypothetical protein